MKWPKLVTQRQNAVQLSGLRSKACRRPVSHLLRIQVFEAQPRKTVSRVRSPTFYAGRDSGRRLANLEQTSRTSKVGFRLELNLSAQLGHFDAQWVVDLDFLTNDLKRYGQRISRFRVGIAVPALMTLDGNAEMIR